MVGAPPCMAIADRPLPNNRLLKIRASLLCKNRALEPELLINRLCITKGKPTPSRYKPPPALPGALLFCTKLSTKIKLDCSAYTPPPLRSALLLRSEFPCSKGAAPETAIPPPDLSAWFARMILFSNWAPLEACPPMKMPPPSADEEAVARFPLITLPESSGEELSM